MDGGRVVRKGRVRERDGDLARAERTNGLSETTRMGGRGSATRRPTIAGDERDTHHALLGRRLHAHATLRHDEPDRAGAPPSPTPARRSN
jgi:hypothetical protein